MMPPVSEKQRAAMNAAAKGKSTLGIPKDVGKEFVKSDKGGKLPPKKTTTGPAADKTMQDMVNKTKGGQGTLTYEPKLPPRKFIRG